MLAEFFMGVGDIIVGDGDRLDLRRQPSSDVGYALRGWCTELVVEDCARGMNMRLPTVPFEPRLILRPSALLSVVLSVASNATALAQHRAFYRKYFLELAPRNVMSRHPRIVLAVSDIRN